MRNFICSIYRNPSTDTLACPGIGVWCLQQPVIQWILWKVLLFSMFLQKKTGMHSGLPKKKDMTTALGDLLSGLEMA